MQGVYAKTLETKPQLLNNCASEISQKCVDFSTEKVIFCSLENY